MGDMGDFYRDWKADVAARKVKRLAKADPTGWLRHTPYHWSQMIHGSKLDYWPSTGKWMYRGTVSRDLKGMATLIASVESRSAEQAATTPGSNAEPDNEDTPW